VTGETPTFGLRRGTLLCLSGNGYRGAIFHLGALTRLNELGLLAGTETICGVGGSSILGALLATRIPWPLHGAFRAWPEEIAEPMREISRRRPRGRGLLARPLASAGAAALEERYARELAGWADAEARGLPRVVFGAAGLQLGRMASRSADEREPDVRWELDEPATGGAGLTPLPGHERRRLENEGYRLADAALREGALAVAAIEPLPPDPPHPAWETEQPRRASRRRSLLPRRQRRGSEGDPAKPAELLQRYRPFLQHDSLECYRPDSVATIAEMEIGPRCNTLHRAGGELIASVLPASGAARLHLGYLGEATYADGRPARSDDYLDEAGGSHARDACAMRRREGYGNVVYGRSVSGGGRLWLQYWLFYYYSDKCFLNVGRHEGDWEMVQLRLGEDGRPDELTLNRHGVAERASWERIERAQGDDGEAPVIYVGRGSHAPLPRPGTYPAPQAPDHNDGHGPRSRPRLVAVPAESPGWLRWPGRWGATRRREAFEGDSPHGPAQQRQWADPAGFHAAGRPLEQSPRWEAPAPPLPRFEARREGNQAILSYSFEAPGTGPAAPGRIVAAALGEGERDEAIVHCFGVEGLSGTCAMPAPLDSRLVAVRACVCSELGTPGRTETVPVG